ncbi:MAG: hypothetical protein R3B49_08470 [Phycisphaerales bacterium]
MPPDAEHAHDPASPATRAPVARLAPAMLASILAVGAIAAAIAWAAAPHALASVAVGAGSALLGAVIGLLPLVLTMSRTPFALALTQVLGSSTRLLAGAGAAIAALLLGGFDPLWTLAVLLAAMLAALGAELAIVFPLLSRDARASAPEPA